MIASPFLASASEGDPIVNVGAVLSTLKVVEGPADAAEFPAASTAVSAAMEIPTVPSPVQLESVTVRVAVPIPLTAFEHVAVPVVLSVRSVPASEMLDAPVYVIV